MTLCTMNIENDTQSFHNSGTTFRASFGRVGFDSVQASKEVRY